MEEAPGSDSFENARQSPHIVVEELPKFDLEAYIGNYQGKTRLNRLYLIGNSSTILCNDALKAAIAEAKNGWDVQQYERAVLALQKADPSDPESNFDSAWTSAIKRQNKIKTDRLELELKGYKNNLIKESIRMGYDDLGQHYQRIGDLAASNKAYAKMRDYCTTNAHIVIMSMHMIDVSVQQRNWLAVQSNATRVRSTFSTTTKDKDSDRNSAKISAALGIAHLALGQYRDAAHEFLQTDPRMAGAKMDDPSDTESYNEVLTPNDIAVYGGLCALASMSREELQRRVLENKTFRTYLELESHIRRAISHFVSSKYSACLNILDSYRADYLLDLYLQPHVRELYAHIRSKAIQQYFIPFSCVTFSALASAFNSNEEDIRAELTRMIKRGDLHARLDLVDRVLVAVRKDGRAEVHAKAIETAREYEKTLRLRLLRMQVLNAGLEVKSSKLGGIAGGQILEDQQMIYNGSAGQGDVAG